MFWYYAPLLTQGQTLLFLAAVIPPLILLIWIFRLDKIESEPKGLIVKLFFFGVLATIAAIIFEGIGEALISSLLSGIVSRTVYNLVMYFIVVALVEEGVKRFALKAGSWKHPAFDYRFDAIVYAVAVSLGFAAAENVGYVFSFGLSNALLRAVTSIPGHCIFGIYMGYYYGMAKYADMHGDSSKRRHYMRMSLLVPVLLHGWYDFTATSGNGTLVLLFFVYIIILDIVAIVSVRRFARRDESLYR